MPTATERNGATATQLVTVNLVDTVAPVITLPADVFTTTGEIQPFTIQKTGSGWQPTQFSETFCHNNPAC